MPRSHFALFQKYFVGTKRRTRPAVLRRQRLAVGFVHDQRVLVLERGERDVRREALLRVRDDEAGARLRSHSVASSRQWTPLKCASKRLQRVTQWMSLVHLGRRQRLELVEGQGRARSRPRRRRAASRSRGRSSGRRRRGGPATSPSGTGPAAGAPGRSRRRAPSPRPSSGRAASGSNTRPMEVATRQRDFVRVAGPDARDYLQRMVSNDVDALGVGDACPALLLTAKARLIAPLVVWRRGEEDFLLLTEPELGEIVRAQLTRMRLRAQCEIEPEEHASRARLREATAIATDCPGAVEVLDAGPRADAGRRRARAAPHRGRRAALGPRARRPHPPGGGWPRRDARQLQQRAAIRGRNRSRACTIRGHVNRRLRVVELDDRGRAVERVTSCCAPARRHGRRARVRPNRCQRLEPADLVVGARGAQPQAGDVSLPAVRLPAARDGAHVLISPEGDTSRRRHAHTECVQAAREQGRMPSYDEWRKTQPRKGIRYTDPSPRRP